MFNREKEVKGPPCMGLIKKTIESHHRTQTVALVAIGFSVVAIVAVLCIVGAKNAAR